MPIGESWHIFTTHVRPRRLLWEDPGVKGPLWFGRRPDSPWHVFANILRLICAFVFAPTYIFIPHSKRSESQLLKKLLWGIEWAKTPDALLLESPGSLVSEEGKIKSALPGMYAVSGNKPRWLMEVTFRGTDIVSMKQVRYEEDIQEGDSKILRTPEAAALRKRIHRSGYTAISYSMESAKALFDESNGQLDPQPEIIPGGNRLYSLRNRRKISHALLIEYAWARKTIEEKEDGVEFIWLDEFCLSDYNVTDERMCGRQRALEVGNLADIFGGAKRVAVFCHLFDCEHTGVNCPWSQRLFTLGEILHTPQVLVMTRSQEFHKQARPTSYITVLDGKDFRRDMQRHAALAKMWHLYNIMQHATNSGGVMWQSAIQSLVVEAIRRDEAGNFHDHNFLGKALNGLLPRRAQLSDLRGANGWADLAWLLELNQGYYNTTLLVAVCKLADPNVNEYRWWGKPIAPEEGTERLEALVTSIPAKLRKADNTVEPVLSVLGPKSVLLEHWLHRDSAGLYNNPEMESLKIWTYCITFILVVIGFALFGVDPTAAGAVLYLTLIGFVTLELLVGTIFVEKDVWIVVEDHATPGNDPYLWLLSQDPSFVTNATEWGARQLCPRWDAPGPKVLGVPTPLLQPYSVTLIDLRTGVLTKAAVSSKPNDMVILAVHGSGITCMLLDRDVKELKSTVATKVGMANVPPFVLAQAERSGTIYVGSGNMTQPPPPTMFSHGYHSTPFQPSSLSTAGNSDPEKYGQDVITSVFQGTI